MLTKLETVFCELLQKFPVYRLVVQSVVPGASTANVTQLSLLGIVFAPPPPSPPPSPPQPPSPPGPGGIEAVVAAVKAHTGVAVVQENGCAALANIVGTAEIQPEVAAAGGIEAVLAAMKAHTGVAAVQELGCWALSNIAGTAENRLKVVAAGGVEVLSTAMDLCKAGTGVVCYRLASLMGHLGRLPNAERVYREALSTRRSDLGEEHPQTRLFTNGIAALMREFSTPLLEPPFQEALGAPCERARSERHSHELGMVVQEPLFWPRMALLRSTHRCSLCGGSMMDLLGWRCVEGCDFSACRQCGESLDRAESAGGLGMVRSDGPAGEATSTAALDAARLASAAAAAASAAAHAALASTPPDTVPAAEHAALKERAELAEASVSGALRVAPEMEAQRESRAALLAAARGGAEPPRRGRPPSASPAKRELKLLSAEDYAQLSARAAPPRFARPQSAEVLDRAQRWLRPPAPLGGEGRALGAIEVGDDFESDPEFVRIVRDE